MPAVTISAGYGLGGSVIARSVADRLGYLLLDRAISSQVADSLQVSAEEAADGSVKRGIIERFFGTLALQVDGGIVDPSTDVRAAPPAMESAQFRERAEAIVREALPGGVVVLGRAGSAMLAAEAHVLRVRLYGADDARIAHAVQAEGVDERTARTRLGKVDRARAHYVKRLYDRDIDDPALYHLQLDSTVVPAEVVADAVVGVYAAFRPVAE